MCERVRFSPEAALELHKGLYKAKLQSLVRTACLGAVLLDLCTVWMYCCAYCLLMVVLPAWVGRAACGLKMDAVGGGWQGWVSLRMTEAVPGTHHADCFT